MFAVPAQRAGTLAVLYVVSYMMFSAPIMVAGSLRRTSVRTTWP